MVEVKSYLRNRMPSGKVLIDDGEILDDYSIDVNSEGEMESNAGTEYKIKYNNKIYFVQEWDDTDKKKVFRK